MNKTNGNPSVDAIKYVMHKTYNNKKSKKKKKMKKEKKSFSNRPQEHAKWVQ